MRAAFLLLCLLTVSVFAQDKPSLGVMVVEFIPKITDEAQRELYTSLVRGRAIELVQDSVDIIEGSNLSKMIQVNMKPCNASSCLAQFAKTLGVDYLLGTRVINHKGTWSATVSLASSRTGSMLSEKVSDYESEASLRKGLAALVSQAVKSLVKSGKSADPGTETGGEETVIAPPQAGAKKVVVSWKSIPPGAAVTVDGKFLCQTDNTKSVVQGEHWIEMGKDGYGSKRDKVVVSRNGQELSWKLVPIQTRLTLDAVDDRTGGDLIGDVYVDGAKVGQTPFDGLVPVTASRIEVAPSGFERKTVSVTLEEGKTASATAHFRDSDVSSSSKVESMKDRPKVDTARSVAHFRSVEKPKAGDGMVAIPSGCFQMGSNDGDANEKPVHQVCLEGFSMDATEVTQSAYQSVMGSNPSHFSSCGVDCPVEHVDWKQASEYCRKVGKRLPTEAEWEYAARAGTTTKWYWGDDDWSISLYAWHSENSGSTTHPVGKKQANAWGLYDMAGNVWEWTADWYVTYPLGSQRNPTGPGSGTYRVFRGGSWYGTPGRLRSAYRYLGASDDRSSFLGFRCVSP